MARGTLNLSGWSRRALLLLGGALAVAGLHTGPQCTPRAALHSPRARASATASLGQLRLYARTLVVPSGSSTALVEAAKLFAGYLRQAAGVPFQVVARATEGIYFLHSDAAGVPAEVADRLRGAGPEAYVVWSGPDARLLVVANDDKGLVFGGYQLLERLGFRFYFPGEAWTIVPQLRDIEGPRQWFGKPRFRMREAAGTGGLGKGLAVDPGSELAAGWARWKVANGFGGEFHVGGHAGESFNKRHRETLLAHPEYLASVNGQRVPWSRGAKLDPTNPEAVDLFVRDRLDAYRTQLRAGKEGADFGVSVEAADGGGHCDSPECAQLGGPSEQEFFLANAVARELSKQYPQAHASLFAYNYHAEVPRLDIEPNVYVTLVPYAFRHDASDAETFIKAWVRKKTPLSVYDYWSIPDWVADQPVLDYRSMPAQKLRFWHEQRIEGFVGETSYSAGAVGLAWYIAAHLMWDTERDPAALADEFFRDSFGVAARPMRRMLERWASGFLLTNAELHSSFADLSEALSQARSAAVRSRIVDYVGYVQYLRLRHEWEVAEANKLERLRALLVHLWRIYPTAMVDTFRLQTLLLRGDNQPLAAEFDPSNADLPVWKSLKPLGEAEARLLVRDGQRAFPQLDVAVRTYAGDLTLVDSEARRDESNHGGAGALQTEMTLVGPNRLELSVAEGVEQLSVEVQSRDAFQARLLGREQQVLATTPVGAGPGTFTLALPKVASGQYALELQATRNARVQVRIPSGLGVELQEFRVPVASPAPDLYFFVPQGQKHVAIYGQYPFRPQDKPQVVLLDSTDTAAPREISDGGHLLTASVPPGQDGKIWILRGAVAPSAPLRLLNAPQRFALSPGALRVPSQALRAPTLTPSAVPASESRR